MPQVLAGVLSMADIALHAITQGEVYLETTSGGTWSVNQWIDLPVTLEIDDIPENSKALCLFQSSMRANYSGTVFRLRCVVDGNAQLESSMTTEGEDVGQYQSSACFAFVSGLSAGKHVFKVQSMAGSSATSNYWRNLRHIVAIMKR